MFGKRETERSADRDISLGIKDPDLNNVTILSKSQNTSDASLTSSTINENVVNSSASSPLRLPLHLRWERYLQTRKRIFDSVDEVHVPKRAVRFREFRDRRSKMRSNPVRISSVCHFPNDERPYATVKIGNQELVGLLDTGASRSCLGRNAEQFLKSAGLEMSPYNECVQTANGSEQQVVGKVRVALSFRGKVRIMTLWVVPTLAQSLYLGIDFWKRFDLAPGLISELASPIIDDNLEINVKYDLTEEESSRLEKVKRKFPSFAIMGLGKTDMEEHIIDTGDAPPIKQRHYPVSPAVQKAMYAELDRMLELGVIE